MDTKLLEEIGLTKGEISVYFALLETGSSTVGPIADKAKVSSSKVYDILERLIDKGLVSHVIKENKKYFEAASPKRILDYLKEKQDKIIEQTENIEKAMPELLLKQNMIEKKQEVTVFEGVKGIKTVREKTFQELKRGEEFYILGASAHSNKRLADYWMNYHKRRADEGIGAKLLINQDAPESDLEARNKIKFTEARYMPNNISTPSWIEIIKDRTVIGVPSETPVAVEIKNKAVAESFKSYFDMLWDQKVTVFEGNKSATRFFTRILNDLKKGEEYFVINANVGIDESQDLIEFFRDYHKKRQEKGIKVNLLLSSRMKKTADIIALPPCEKKFLPPEFQTPLQITFYKDKMYISVWGKNSIGILINRKDIINDFKAYFDSLWNQK